jgi:epoxyqueuosine reductase
MIDVVRDSLTAADVKRKALALGADLVGIADGEAMNAHPPDPDRECRPIDITELDYRRVIVLAKRLSNGTARIAGWGDRTKFYNDELALSALESASLDLVYWLEARGYPAVIVPPTHVDPRRYGGDPTRHLPSLLSLPHAAVEAGLGTLGLNQQLLTPEFGPRVLLTAVLSSLDVEPDRRRETALCRGPSCGRCLSACPADAVRHWQRDWEACDTYRSPYGFAKLSEHLANVMGEADPQKKKDLLRTETMFNLWQSILRGSGVITGCRRCADVCPVGADYEESLRDVLEQIPEDDDGKRKRLSAMVESEARGEPQAEYVRQVRWIGRRTPDGPAQPDSRSEPPTSVHLRS